MKPAELHARARHARHVEGLSQKGAARHLGIDPKSVAGTLRRSVPPGYRRTKPRPRPRLDVSTDIIDRIPAADRSAPPEQPHTAKRIYERPRDEHGDATR